MAKNNRPDLPHLAQYRSISEYLPHYGDYVVWTGWLSTWHGLVTDFDEATGDVSVIFAGMPYLLFTLTPEEQVRETRKLKLSAIHAARHGTFAVNEHDHTRNASIWYV